MTGYVDEAAVLPASTAIPSVVRLPEVSSDFSDLDDIVAAVVAAVGAMASGRDKVTMIIAGLAAAVVAFGPALL